jgi:hypothetical protein
LLIKGQRILGSGAPSNKTISTLIETSRRLQIVRWYGNNVPLLLSNLSANSPTLFWPHSPNYPGVDALIWMPDNKTLLLVQITLSSVQEHASNLWVEQQELEAKWRAILGGGTQTTVKGLWITPRPAGRTLNEGQHVCTLQGLLADNPERFRMLGHLAADKETAASPPQATSRHKRARGVAGPGVAQTRAVARRVAEAANKARGGEKKERKK